MAIYFIDGDNAPGTRTCGIENLTEKDKVFIFYAKSNTHYTSKDIRQGLERKTTAQLSFVQVCDGKNAVDFAVATRAGYYASNDNEKIFLVSGDKHFDMIAQIIGKELAQGCSIKRVDTLSIALISDAENIATLDIAENLIKINFGAREGEAFMKRICELAIKENEPCKEPQKKKTIFSSYRALFGR